MQKGIAAEVLGSTYFLNYALGSLGESVSSMHAYIAADLVNREDVEAWDFLAYKIENRMIKLIASLQTKKYQRDWDDQFVVKDMNVVYGGKGG